MFCRSLPALLAAPPCIPEWMMHLNNFCTTLLSIRVVVSVGHNPNCRTGAMRQLSGRNWQPVLHVSPRPTTPQALQPRSGVTSHLNCRTRQPLLCMSLRPTILPQALQPRSEPVPRPVPQRPVQPRSKPIPRPVPQGPVLLLLRRVLNIILSLLANVLACTMVYGT